MQSPLVVFNGLLENPIISASRSGLSFYLRIIFQNFVENAKIVFVVLERMMT